MAPDRERIASAGGASRLLRLHDVVLAGSLFKPAQTYTLKARLGKTEKSFANGRKGNRLESLNFLLRRD
jgi:hypothetical protein